MATYIQIPPDTELLSVPNSECCCDKPFHLGCYSHCSIINLDPIFAPETGDYEFVFTLAGNKIVQKGYFEENDILSFKNIFEVGLVQLVIVCPTLGKIRISETETVRVGCEDTEVTTIYDCFIYKSQIRTNVERMNDLPCSGSESVTFDRLVWVASDEHNHIDLEVSRLYIETAKKTTYRLYYTPNTDCNTDNTIPTITSIVGYTISDVLNVSDSVAGNYIQFSIKSSKASVTEPIALEINGLCNACYSVIYNTTAQINNCVTTTNAEFIGLATQNGIIYPNSFTVPEDVNNIGLWLELFRKCCRNDIIVNITGIVVPTGFKFTNKVTIESGYSDEILEFKFPSGSFTAQIQIEISGSCITTQTLVFDFSR